MCGNLFRKNRLADVMDDIFTQVVQMLVDAMFVSLEVQYIDGTKIEANANKYTFVWNKVFLIENMFYNKELPVTHNIRKMIAKGYCVCSKGR